VAHPTKLEKQYEPQDNPKSKPKAYYPVPTAYDVKGASEWYDKGDNILSIWRDVRADDGKVEVHVQKVRFRDVGKPGVARLGYDVITSRFTDPLGNNWKHDWRHS
jgi:twinkle protein